MTKSRDDGPFMNSTEPATNNFLILGYTRPEIEFKIYRTRVGHPKKSLKILKGDNQNP